MELPAEETPLICIEGQPHGIVYLLLSFPIFLIIGPVLLYPSTVPKESSEWLYAILIILFFGCLLLFYHFSIRKLKLVLTETGLYHFNLFGVRFLRYQMIESVVILGLAMIIYPVYASNLPPIRIDGFRKSFKQNDFERLMEILIEKEPLIAGNKRDTAVLKGLDQETLEDRKKIMTLGIGGMQLI